MRTAANKDNGPCEAEQNGWADPSHDMDRTLARPEPDLGRPFFLERSRVLAPRWITANTCHGDKVSENRRFARLFSKTLSRVCGPLSRQVCPRVRLVGRWVGQERAFRSSAPRRATQRVCPAQRLVFGALSLAKRGLCGPAGLRNLQREESAEQVDIELLSRVGRGQNPRIASSHNRLTERARHLD
jgi:hypothetical protein